MNRVPMRHLVTLLLASFGLIALTAWLSPVLYNHLREDHRWLPKVSIDVQFESDPTANQNTATSFTSEQR